MLRFATPRARSDIKIKDVLTRCKVGCAQHEGQKYTVTYGEGAVVFCRRRILGG